MTRHEQVLTVLNGLGGVGSLTEIYAGVGSLSGGDLTTGERAGVRKAIEDHSSDSANWSSGRPDLFYSAGGIGAVGG